MKTRSQDAGLPALCSQGYRYLLALGFNPGGGVGIGPRLDENEFPDLVLGSLPKFSKTPLLLGPEATQSQQQPRPISMVGPVCLLKLRPFSHSWLLDRPFLISTFRRLD